MARIELEHVSVAVAPDGVVAGPLDLVVDDGECLAFLAPDPRQGGAILRAAAGLVRPRGGRIAIDGEPLDPRRPPPAQVGFGFAPPFAYEHLSVARNLDLATAGSIEAGAAVGRVAGLFELQSWLEVRAHDLPGDVLAVVDVCRALVKPPPAAVFLDHPFADMGVDRRQWAWARLARWRQLEGPAIVIATDDAGLALTLADRIVAHRDGVVVQIGTPVDLVERPADLALAAATGSLGINRLPCAVEADALMITGTDFGLAGEWLAAARAASGAIDLAIRPEHVQLAKDPLDWAIPAAVLRRDLCAYGTLVTASLGEHTVMAIAPSTMPPLEQVHLYLPPERLSLFADGQRVR